VGGGGYGGGGYGSSGRTDDDDDTQADERIKDLEESFTSLVEREVEGQLDVEGGASMDFWQSRLMLVKTTPRAHRRIAKLLQSLRSFKEVQIAVDARFITLRNNFLEEIGVNLDLVLNSGDAGYDQALSSTGAALTDPRTGQLLIMPRRFTQLGMTPAAANVGGVPLTSVRDAGTLGQPFGNVALVTPGQPGNYLSRHTTPVPIINNTLDLAGPRMTNVPGSLADQYQSAGPAWSMYGSFLDNIQVDFLMRATQIDSRGSSVDAPRLVCMNNAEGYVEVNTYSWYISQPGVLATSGTSFTTGSSGQQPSMAALPIGRTFGIRPWVSVDRRYVTMEVKPSVNDATFQKVPTPGGVASFMQLPEQKTTSVRTTVTVPDKGTLLLGGLKLSAEEEIEAGVPIVSKIPVLKRAFTNRSRTKDDYVLLILIKPTIIIAEEQEEKAYPDAMTSDSGAGG